jgi:allantoicase
MSSKSELDIDLAQNGECLFSTDDFFAAAEGLIQRAEPISNDEFTGISTLLINSTWKMDGRLGV